MSDAPDSKLKMFLADFALFASECKKHYGAWVGGLFVTILALFTSLPHWLIWPWLIVGLFVSAFLAWRDKNRALQKALSDAATNLDDVAKLRLLESNLSSLWKTGGELLKECDNYKEPPPQDKADQWDEEVIQFLETRLGEPKKDFYLSGQRHKFVFTGEQPPFEHRELMGLISLRVDNLRKILDDLPPAPPL